MYLKGKTNVTPEFMSPHCVLKSSIWVPNFQRTFNQHSRFAIKLVFLCACILGNKNLNFLELHTQANFCVFLILKL